MEATDGGEVYSPNVGGKRFWKISSLALADARREDPRRWRSVLFCREQKRTKRVAPKGPNLRFAPSGLPHSRGDGLRERNPPHWRTAPARLGQNRSTAPLLKYGSVPGCTLSGGLAKPFFHWQSTRAARRIAGKAEALALRLILRQAAPVRLALCSDWRAFAHFEPCFDWCAFVRLAACFDWCAFA